MHIYILTIIIDYIKQKSDTKNQSTKLLFRVDREKQKNKFKWERRLNWKMPISELSFVFWKITCLYEGLWESYGADNML